MFLTKITLDKPFAFNKALKDAQEMHRFTLGFFPQVESPHARSALNVLWRLEQTSQRIPYILMYSETQPVLDSYSAKYLDHLTLETREAGSALDAIADREEVSAKVRIKPIKTSQKKEKALSPNEIIPAFLPRLESAGLAVTEGKIEYVPTPSVGIGKGTAPAGDLIFRATVSDADKLKTALREGIGRGKNYGYGMLLIGG